MNTLGVNQETLLKILHDLRGPLVNLKGFHSELDETVGRMRYFIDRGDEQLPCNSGSDLNSIVSDDLVPIIRFLSISIGQLHERLDLFEKEATNIVG
ncbi:MAG: hypothetical protein V3U76_07000 [Granulosicoccus sp.]